tara:strand:- start:443 stop:1441 length:999 start_codon:yes stop_codon:yes gene_type:complete
MDTIRSLINQQYNPAEACTCSPTNQNLSEEEWFEKMGKTIYRERSRLDPNTHKDLNDNKFFYDLGLLSKDTESRSRTDIRTDKCGRFRVPGTRVVRYFLEDKGAWEYPTSFEGLNQDQIKEIDNTLDTVLYSCESSPFAFDVKVKRTFWLMAVAGEFPHSREYRNGYDREALNREVVDFCVSVGSQYGVSFDTILRLACELRHCVSSKPKDLDEFSSHRNAHNIRYGMYYMNSFMEMYYKVHLEMNYMGMVEDLQRNLVIFHEDLKIKMHKLVQKEINKFLVHHQQEMGTDILKHTMSKYQWGLCPSFDNHKYDSRRYWLENKALQKALAKG